MEATATLTNFTAEIGVPLPFEGLNMLSLAKQSVIAAFMAPRFNRTLECVEAMSDSKGNEIQRSYRVCRDLFDATLELFQQAVAVRDGTQATGATGDFEVLYVEMFHFLEKFARFTQKNFSDLIFVICLETEHFLLHHRWLSMTSVTQCARLVGSTRCFSVK